MKVSRPGFVARACLALFAVLLFALPGPAENSLGAGQGLFLFQRCAGLYYALAQYFDDAGEAGNLELRNRMLDDARAAETAALHYRALLQGEREPGGQFSGAQYRQWSESIHANALTIANQNYHLLKSWGTSILVQDLAPCNEAHALQNAIVRGQAPQ